MKQAVEIVAELEHRYASAWPELRPVAEDIERWTDGRVEAVPGLYDGIAAELARGYAEKRYSFAFCDGVVNQLHAVLVSRHQSSWPKLFQRVYDAFDAGEFHRRTDKTDDPISDYTDPEITKIVRGL